MSHSRFSLCQHTADCPVTLNKGCLNIYTQWLNMIGHEKSACNYSPMTHKSPRLPQLVTQDVKHSQSHKPNNTHLYHSLQPKWAIPLKSISPIGSAWMTSAQSITTLTRRHVKGARLSLLGEQRHWMPTLTLLGNARELIQMGSRYGTFTRQRGWTFGTRGLREPPMAMISGWDRTSKGQYSHNWPNKLIQTISTLANYVMAVEKWVR